MFVSTASRDDADGSETNLTSNAHCGTCDTSCTPPATCITEGDGWFCGSGCPDEDGDGFADATCGGTLPGLLLVLGPIPARRRRT